MNYKTFLLSIFWGFAHYNLFSINIISIHNVIKENPLLHYQKIDDSFRMHLASFPIASSEDSSYNCPLMPESFILTLTNGRLFSDNGILLLNDTTVIQELLWPWSKIKKEKILELPSTSNPLFIKGRIASIAQEGYKNYYHWMTEIVPKILMLKDAQIEYDLLYVPRGPSFIKETLDLLGINPDKIIASDSTTFIEAEYLIIPSFVSLSCYSTKETIESLWNAFLPIIKKSVTPKKVFISREKAAYRKIINEEDLFTLLSKKGFKKYYLEEMTVIDQINLFHNADIIVAAHGAGLTNIIFCQPQTKIYEIFQEHEDDTFWHLSQVIGNNHTCIKTTEFKKNGGYTNTTLSEEVLTYIDNIIE